MLPVKHRLAKTKDIQQVFARGRTFFSSFYMLRYLSRAQGVRVTVVVPTKVSKKATRRNQIKRVIREFLRAQLAQLKSGDYLVVAKAMTAKAENQKLRDALALLFKNPTLVND